MLLHDEERLLGHKEHTADSELSVILADFQRDDVKDGVIGIAVAHELAIFSLTGLSIPRCRHHVDWIRYRIQVDRYLEQIGVKMNQVFQRIVTQHIHVFRADVHGNSSSNRDILLGDTHGVLLSTIASPPDGISTLLVGLREKLYAIADDESGK